MTDEVIAKAAEAFTVRDMVGDIRMAPEPKPSPVKETKVYPCKMGCYGRIIELAVPADIVRWSKGAAVKITHTADLANIELRVSEGGRCRFDQNNNRLRFSYALEGPVARFGMSPAEAIIVDGVVLISCRVDTRAVVNQSLSAAGRLGGANKTTYKAPLPPASPAEIRRREAPAAEPLESIEGRMIALLRELREIEALGTHRLKPIGFDFPKAPSRWEFRPVGRTIKLED
ncbi:MAG TPA: hypothetical protein VGR84_18765 [Candidatus Acidoferrales bacterium]|nr:hypothetical protein [Candidatus Acidoferrales bacterium]